MRLEAGHLTTEEIEDYHFGRLRGLDLRRVEEHLLSCVHCIDRMDAIDRLITMIKAGLIGGSFEIDLLAEEYRPKRARRAR